MLTKIQTTAITNFRKKWSVPFFVLLFLMVSCSLPRTVGIKNKANPDSYIKVENDKLSAGPIGDNKSSGLWQMEKLDEQHFTLKKMGSNNKYLHGKNGALGYSAIPASDQTAHWKMTKLDDNQHYKITNRANPDHTLHIKSGALTLSDAVMAQGSEHWAIVDPSIIPATPAGTDAMMEVPYLGVGYDAVRVDPEKLAANSVRNGSLNPPQVFNFTPGTKTYEVKDNPEGKTIKKSEMIPAGVIVKPGSNTFSWSQKARWVMNASSYQESFSSTFSGNIGLPDVASIKLSASFEDVASTTSSRENAYVYKEGSFSGRNLTLDLSQMTGMLTPVFKEAVAGLGTGDPAKYDAFIQNWGTHFSTDNTIGGKCSYRYTLNKSDYARSSKTKQEFTEGVEATIEGIKGGIEAKQTHETAKSVSNKIKATEFTFLSQGGNANYNDFEAWAEAAQVNPTIIDLRLRSYLELFNVAFFPNDQQIKTKYDLLNQALQRYYKKNHYTEGGDPLGFFKKGPRKYTVSFDRLYVKQGNPDNVEEIRNYGAILYLGVFNQNGETLQKKFILNENGDMWWNGAEWKGNVIFIKQYGDIKKPVSFDITIQPDQFPGTFATIVGKMVQTWIWGLDSGKHDMGNKDAFDVDPTETIDLAEMKVGAEKVNKVTYTNKAPGEQDEVELRFKVKRTQ